MREAAEGILESQERGVSAAHKAALQKHHSGKLYGGAGCEGLS